MQAVVPVPFDFIAHGLLVSLAVVLPFSAAVGLLLILRPATGLQFNRRSSRWVETRGLLRILDRGWSVEPWCYRHHRAIGVAIAAGAATVLWLWLQTYDRAQALRALAPRLEALALDWIAAGLEWAIVLIHAGVLLLGITIVARPSAIKNLEARANHWYGPGGAITAALDREYYGAERWLERHPRLLGAAALGGSLYALLALSPTLLGILSSAAGLR